MCVQGVKTLIMMLDSLYGATVHVHGHGFGRMVIPCQGYARERLSPCMYFHGTVWILITSDHDLQHFLLRQVMAATHVDFGLVVHLEY